MLKVLCKRFCGIWPDENKPIYYIKLLVNVASITYLLIGFSLHLLRVVTDPSGTVSNLADALFTLQCTFNYSFNYIGCAVLYKTSLRFFGKITDFKEFGVPKTLPEIDRELNRNVKIMVGYCTASAISIHLYSLLSYNRCFENHIGLQDISYCGYCCGMYYPYDYNHGFSFAFHVLINTYTFSMLCFSEVIFICAGYCGIEYIAVRIDHLVEMLETVLNEGRDSKLTREKLKICIKYHIYIIRLANGLNDCYSIINTPAVFFYSVTLGLCLFSLIKDYSYKAALVVIGYVCGTFVMSASGQNLLDKSLYIGQAVYDTKWYQHDVKIRKYLFIMMLRSQKGLTYNAGPFGIFSLPVFMLVIRGAYTYMTMQSNIK